MLSSKSIRLTLLLSILGFASCERELLPLDPSLSITGFEVRGTVSDRFGNPIPGVAISVDYLLEYVDDGPEPTRTYIVQPPNESITISVVNGNNASVYSYAAGTQIPGSFTYIWDQTSSSGQDVPSGIYTVRYVTGAGVRHSYPVLVSGTRVATTDSLGRYTVPNGSLPVDYYPVPDYSSSGSTFYGNFRVTSEVVIGFSVDGIEVFRTVVVTRNRVVFLDARMN